MLGDHMELVANLDGFKETVIDKKTGIEKTMTKCAPLGAKFAINNIDPTKQVIDLNFLDVEQKRIHWYNNLFSRQDTVEKEKRALAACEAANRVNDYTSYQIENTKLASAAVKRTGIAFGMLVVPFKFRLGNAKDLVSSSTVAPYVGFRTSWAQSFGLRFTPIVSAGLGMVPVADASGKGTSTKAAFSTAAGLLLTSNKSEQFSVGALIGRDFLGRTDREADSAVSKLWVSFYIGLAF